MRNIKYEEDYGVIPERSKELIKRDEDNAKVFNGARVFGNSWIYGDTEVFGDVQVFGDAQVFGRAIVSGKTIVSGDTMVYDNAGVYDKARILRDDKSCPSGDDIKNSDMDEYAEYIRLCKKFKNGIKIL